MAGTYALTTAAKCLDYLGLSADKATIIDRLVDVATAKIERFCNRQFVSRSYTSWLDGSGDIYQFIPNYPIITLSRVCTQTRGAMSVTNDAAETALAYATVSASTTGLSLSYGGSASSLLYADYATLTLLVAAVDALGNSWDAAVLNDYGALPSSEIRPFGPRGCQGNDVQLDIPDEPVEDVEYDEQSGRVWTSGGFAAGRANIFIAYNGGYATIPDDIEQAAIELVGKLYHAATKDRTIQSESLGDYSWTAVNQVGLETDMQVALMPYRRIVIL